MSLPSPRASALRFLSLCMIFPVFAYPFYRYRFSSSFVLQRMLRPRLPEGVFHDERSPLRVKGTEIFMFKLLRFLRGYEKESIVGPLFKFLEACFELVVPLLMAEVIDVGIRENDIPYIWMMCGVMLLMGLLGFLCSVTAQYFAAKAAAGFGCALRKAAFSHIMRFSDAELDAMGIPTLTTRITSDINQAQNGVNLILRLLLRAPFIVIGAIVMAFFVNVRLTLIFLIAAPLLSLAIYWILSRSLPKYKQIQRRVDDIAGITRENLSGARVVRAFSAEKREAEQFHRTADTLMREQLMVGRLSALLNPVTYVLVNLAIAAILWFGGLSVNSSALSQGEIIALVNYMTQILLALIATAHLIVILTKAWASASRIHEIFMLEPSLCDTPEGKTEPVPGAPAVSFENVTFSYHQSEEPVLSDISFQAMPGETIGIIGGTGAGKSTLIRLIPRFYDTASGSVSVFGRPVSSWPLADLRARIGLVPQKATLFKGTIRENLQWADAGADDDALWQALSVAQAEEVVRSKPELLDAPVEAGGRNFSGGQRQRLTIARALVGRPDVLILDDSASALDDATDARLRSALRRHTVNTTVFIVSQRVAAVRFADRILCMDDGRIVGSGTHGELFESCEVYREICLSQLSEKEASSDA